MDKEVATIDFKEKYKEPLLVNKVQGVDYEQMYDKIAKKLPFDQQEKIAYAKMKAREEYYEKIDVNYVFEKLMGVRRTKEKWRLGSGNVIFTEDQRWKFVSGANSDVKGRLGVKLVEVELGINSFQVIDWFTEHFGVTYSDTLQIASEFLSGDYVSEKGKNKNVFSPPFRNDNNWPDVFRYLNEARNIPTTLLNQLFEQGKLYADTDSRCVFLSNASAEIRGTPASSDPSFKGCSTGGQSDVSGFSIMPQLSINESVIAITEAAVDAISYNALYPGRYVFSSNGSGRSELHYKVALEGLANGFRVSIATDADVAGDVAAQKVFSAFLIRDHIYQTYKKDHPKLQYKDIDKAIIGGHIVIKVDESPHHLFFNEIRKGETLKNAYPVYERMAEDGIIQWKDTGRLSEKEVNYKILQGAFDFISESVDISVLVENERIEKLSSRYSLMRDRPENAKDWNEELKMLGSGYSNNFNKCFNDGFKELPDLPEYLAKNRKDINPIVIGEDGNATIKQSSKTTENKNEVKKQKAHDEQHITPPTVFKVKMSRQQLFNMLYIRLYYNQKFNMPFEEIDQKLKDKEIKFYIDKNQPYLNFVDKEFHSKLAYIPKNQEDGEQIFYPPTIRMYGSYFKENTNVSVSERAFYEVIKRIDYLANQISSSSNQFETLNALNINCFTYEEDGFPLGSIMGFGKLTAKHEAFKSEKMESNKSQAPYRRARM